MERWRNLRDTIARDVRGAVLNAQIAFQRIAVMQQLLKQGKAPGTAEFKQYRACLATAD